MNGLNNPIGYKSNQTLQQPFIMNPFRFGGGAVGAWKELDRTTTGSAVSDFSVGSLPDMQYYMVLTNILGKNNSGVNWQMRMGNPTIDTGNNYSFRYSLDGGADSTSTSQSGIQNGTNPTDLPQFNVAYISNLSSTEKLMTSHDVNQNTAGAGTATQRGEYVGKWANTSNPISIIGATTGSGSYTFNSGSEMVILGWDTSDTHSDTDNFWQELASVDYDASTPDELVTGTIPAKKYLFVQAYINGTAVGLQDNTSFRFNGDVANNYSFRNSNDGAADTTVVNYNYLRTLQSDTGTKSLSSTFIVNNSANEKLLISNAVKFTTAGAGTAPDRNEMTGKWANTSAQITDIKYWQSGSGSFDTGSTLKVWGHD